MEFGDDSLALFLNLTLIIGAPFYILLHIFIPLLPVTSTFQSAICNLNGFINLIKCLARFVLVYFLLLIEIVGTRFLLLHKRPTFVVFDEV